ncbi:hypothetical protein SteCoe_9887 [Stentor coeruleus]|uniref:Uncharacterized protein n=1 Tax=Stentor coeruleus TaxID=5963 RepID=A0A1R2CGZ7_9CILI|nr:hypothetical protein SteCoe_9887 [Stentor coeruleus]
MSLPKVLYLLAYLCLFWLVFYNFPYLKTLKIYYFPSFYSKYNPKISTTLFPILQSNTDLPDPEPIKNSNFQYKSEFFSQGNIENLHKEGLQCNPISYGYNKTEGNKIFPPFNWPECSSLAKRNESYIKIDRISNQMYMTCPKGKDSYYFTGPLGIFTFTSSETQKYYWRVEKYSDEIKADNIEFAIGRCGNKGKFKEVALVPIFNQELFKNLKSFVKNKPRMIIQLTLDSISRNHFYRKLTSLVEFLNNFSNLFPNLTVHDFKLHSTIGVDSIGNMIPLLGGKDKFIRSFKGNQKIDYYGDKALWNILKKKGYLSLIASDGCSDNFSSSLGENLSIDYSLRQFFCACSEYSIHTTKKKATKQKCIGPYQAHYYLLNYTKTLAKMYSGVNLWFYLHLNAAHEESGQHASALDEDLKQFLEHIIKESQDKYDIFIMMHGDHGMRYGPWLSTIDGYQEKKLPVMFLISSKSILDEFPYSYHSLHINTLRLTSNYDLRETQLAVAGITEPTSYSINLLDKISKKSRICEDISSIYSYCACSSTLKLDLESPYVEKILNQLLSYTERIINAKSYSHPKYPLGKICRKVNLNFINRAFLIVINNVSEIFKIETFLDDSNARFEINVYVYSDDSGDSQGEISESIVAYGHRMKVKILNIKRLDSYAGKCKKKAKNAGLDPATCICS